MELLERVAQEEGSTTPFFPLFSEHCGKGFLCLAFLLQHILAVRGVLLLSFQKGM